MTSTASASRPRRKPPGKRRDEIAHAAGQIASEDGLAQLTAKRVAEAVGVYPGLVNHYFRSADELAAAAFAAAAERQRKLQAAKLAEARSPTAALRMFLHGTFAPEHDSVALLWLDAWRESRRRPALQREVISQMEIDLADLTDLLVRGVAACEFTTGDCAAAAMRILAMIDGTFGQSAVRTAIEGTTLLNYPVVTEMLLRATEEDLGLDAGSLG